MQHKSFFSRPVSAEMLIMLARDFEADIAVVGSGDCADLDHTARIGVLGQSGLGYYDGAPGGIESTGAGVVITNAESVETFDAALILVSRHPRKLFIQVMNALLAGNPIDHGHTIVEIPAQVSPGESRIDAGATVLPGSRIGKGCIIETGAIVLPGVILEDGVHVKTGAILGSSGAAIVVTDCATLSQPHLGTLIIGAGTEIGSQSNLVRGIFGATTVGRRCVIGNHVNIGHNCMVGSGVWLGAAATVGGYTRIGNFTNIGMGSICKNGLAIGTGCNVAMGSCLMKNLPDGMSCIGNPAKETQFRFHAGPAVKFPLPPGHA